MARAGARAEGEAKKKTRRSSSESAPTIQGLPARMGRAVDQAKPCHCHGNIVVISAAELRCAACDAHRGWLSKTTFQFLTETVRLFGVPAEPFIIRDTGDTQMHIDSLFPNKWLKASDLCNKAITVTIEKVEEMEVGSEREKRPVVSFVGKTKKLILNKTNTRAIGDLYGGETDDWPTHKIVLFPTSTQYGDKEMATIRVKPPKDYVRPEAADEDEAVEPSSKRDNMDDEIPF